MKEGLSFCAHFSLFTRRGESPVCREAEGARDKRAANNKEVPLDAREDHFEMQRVQAEKLQHDEKQEEQP